MNSSVGITSIIIIAGKCQAELGKLCEEIPGDYSWSLAHINVDSCNNHILKALPDLVSHTDNLEENIIQAPLAVILWLLLPIECFVLVWLGCFV